MNAPVAASVNGNAGGGNDAMVGITREEIITALGRAAQATAQKGAGATNGREAQDYGNAALAFVQAAVLLANPHPTPPPSHGAGGPPAPAQQGSGPPAGP